MIYAVIVACEVGFWVVLLAGFTARYLLRRPRLGAALLVCVPLADLVLLVASALDLRYVGGQADLAHGLAAIYLGVSVAWGHSMVRWADARFAHRFAGGPRPRARSEPGPSTPAASAASGGGTCLRGWSAAPSSWAASRLSEIRTGPGRWWASRKDGRSCSASTSSGRSATPSGLARSPRSMVASTRTSPPEVDLEPARLRRGSYRLTDLATEPRVWVLVLSLWHYSPRCVEEMFLEIRQLVVRVRTPQHSTVRA